MYTHFEFHSIYLLINFSKNLTELHNNKNLKFKKNN